jgi:hypothetical protein
MEFKKLNFFQKYYLKFTNKPAYRIYKKRLKFAKFENRMLQQQHPNTTHQFKALTSFVHSGNSGDIIYALPAIFALSKNGKASLQLKINQKGIYDGFHPLGNVMLNQKMVDMLKPLIEYQPQIAQCAVYSDDAIDYDLDVFRNYPMMLDRGNIARWYFNVFGISYPLHKPWLTAPKDEKWSNTIVVARSHRYRSPGIDYSILNNYPNKVFVGIKPEYEDMQQALPDIAFAEVNNFLELATIINSCKLFIGNQSFPFSIAEALKVNRLLEVFYECPNVVVEGEGANDFMYQPQFETQVKRLLQ